jgi:Mor family transcriptional regulator
MAVKAEFTADTTSFVQAVDKADKSLEKFGKTAGTMKSKVSEFDQLLQKTTGVSIGPVAQAFDEVSASAGKTVTQLGAVATGGLVVGTAMAAWDFGRAIAGFFDLDTVIGDATAALLGFGDVAAESAGAKADTLARASKLAGFEVSQLSTAAVIFAEHQQRMALATLDTTKRITAWHGELTRAGVDTEALSAEIKTQALSVEELARKYGISVGAIKNFVREEQSAATAAEEASKKIQTANARLLKDTQVVLDYNAALNRVMVDTGQYEAVLATIPAEIQKQITAQVAQGASLEDLQVKYTLTDIQIRAYEKGQQVAAATTEAHTAAMQHQAEAHAAMLAEMEQEIATRKRAQAAQQQSIALAEAEAKANRALGGSMTFDLSTPEGMAAFKAANPGATVSVGPDYFLAHTLQEAIAAGFVDLYAAFRAMAGGLPHFASGGVSRGGAAIVGERGPELVTLPAGARVSPGVGGGAPSITIHMSGMLLSNSPAGRAEFAAFAGQALLSQLRAHGWRSPAVSR